MNKHDGPCSLNRKKCKTHRYESHLSGESVFDRQGNGGVDLGDALRAEGIAGTVCKVQGNQTDACHTQCRQRFAACERG